MIKKWYRFGKTAMYIQRPDNMIIPENMSKFEISEPSVEDMKVFYEIEFVDDTKPVCEKIIANEPKVLARRINFIVMETPTGECRFLYLAGWSLPFAAALQTAEDKWKVRIDIKSAGELHWDTVFISVLSLEKHIISWGGMILHTAFLCHDGEAVLFSGPSEVGKSTQAGLWEKYREGSRTINGDRCLLRKENGTWYACGWPICGSSGICNNEKYPVKAIVMLRQAKENRCERLSGAKAFGEVFAQLTVNNWNTDFKRTVIDNTESLLNEIEVYELYCDISENAVKSLEEKLYPQSSF